MIFENSGLLISPFCSFNRGSRFNFKKYHNNVIPRLSLVIVIMWNFERLVLLVFVFFIVYGEIKLYIKAGTVDTSVECVDVQQLQM